MIRLLVKELGCCVNGKKLKEEGGRYRNAGRRKVNR